MFTHADPASLDFSTQSVWIILNNLSSLHFILNVLSLDVRCSSKSDISATNSKSVTSLNFFLDWKVSADHAFYESFQSISWQKVIKIVSKSWIESWQIKFCWLHGCCGSDRSYLKTKQFCSQMFSIIPSNTIWFESGVNLSS